VVRLPLQWLALAGAALAALAAAGCSRCDDEFCSLATRPLRGEVISQGFAGLIVQRSDLELDGCRPCSPDGARLHLWRTPASITTAGEAEAIVAATPPAGTHVVSTRFEHDLDAGSYLGCVFRGACASFEVQPARVTTLHVWKGFGQPSDLNLLDPDGRPRRDRVFSQERPDFHLSIALDGVGHFAGPIAQLSVSEPDGAGGGGIFVRIFGERGQRGISLLVQQPEPWPPRPSFDLAVGGGNLNTIADVENRGPGGVARSGHLDLVVDRNRLAGSFQAEMVQGGRMWSLAGTLSGELSFSCRILSSRTATGQTIWSDDPTFATPFCADIARQAGIPPRSRFASGGGRPRGP
jgi:hypothetical protein